MHTQPRRLSRINRPVVGTIAAPGSKSDTHRALLLAAHARTPSQIDTASDCDDTDVLVAALRKFGIAIVRSGNTLHVAPPAQLEAYEGEIDCNLAGTSFRFLLPLCATVRDSQIQLTGSVRMCERPIGGLVDMLIDGGAQITYDAHVGCPPITIQGVTQLRGGDYELHDNCSSQYVSAMLLNATVFAGPIRVRFPEQIGSRSYIEMTIRSLQRFGYTVAAQASEVAIANPSRVDGQHYIVDGDASSATYFLALAAVTGGCVRVTNLPKTSPQGDLRFASILAEMGCRTERYYDAIEVDASESGALRGIDVDLSDCPDTAPTLAVVAALADGQSVLRGLGSLVHKESDRMVAIAMELQRAGIDVKISADTLTIFGGTPRAAAISPHGDHRIAMACALLSARTGGIEITHPYVVSKSFRGFWDSWAQLIG
ncbi:MAG: 3-phosphoshikimate 1-carboxyvinyltransferase [Planctomycetota bacterium]